MNSIDQKPEVADEIPVTDEQVEEGLGREGVRLLQGLGVLLSDGTDSDEGFRFKTLKK